MIDQHVREAFLDLVDGQGPPHHPSACAACSEAAELWMRFEGEFETTMQAITPVSPPAGLLAVATPRRVRLATASWLAAAAILLLAGVVIALPGSLSVGPAPTASPTPTASSSPDPAAIEDRRLEELAEALGTSPFQAAILEDGEVTADEYQLADRSYLQCLLREGIVPEVSRDMFGIIEGVSFSWDISRRDLGSAGYECQREYFSEVSVRRRAAVRSTDPAE